MISVVRYRVATYEGVLTVTGVDPGDDEEHVVARARRILAHRCGGSLPFGSESWVEISRDHDPAETM